LGENFMEVFMRTIGFDQEEAQCNRYLLLW